MKSEKCGILYIDKVRKHKESSMATDGVNNNASTSFDLSKYENINKGTDAQVEQNISIFTQDVEQFVNDAWSSGGGMDDKETDIIFNCLKKMDEVFSSLSKSLKTNLKASVENFFLFILKDNGMSNNYTSDSGNIKYKNGELTINDSESQETKEYAEQANFMPQETDAETEQYGEEDVDKAAKTYWNDIAEINKLRDDPEAFADAKIAFDKKYSNVRGNPRFEVLIEQERNEYLAKSLGRAQKKARQHGTTPENAAKVLGLNPNDFQAKSSKITKRRR